MHRGNLSRRGFLQHSCRPGGGRPAGLVCPRGDRGRRGRPEEAPATRSSLASSAWAARRAAAWASTERPKAWRTSPGRPSATSTPSTRPTPSEFMKKDGHDGRDVQGLPPADRPQGHQRRPHRHARPLARPGRHRRAAQGQGRLLREAADADRRGGHGGDEGGQGDRPRPPDRQPAATEIGGRFRLACELVRNGRIGKLKTIEMPHRRRTRLSGPIPEVEAARGAGLGLLARADAEGAVSSSGDGRQDELPLRVPLVVRVLRRQDDRLGRHHNDIAQWALGMDGSGPVAVEASRRRRRTQGPNSYNCHPTSRSSTPTTTAPRSGRQRRRGTDAEGVLVDKDGKPRGRRQAAARRRQRERRPVRRRERARSSSAAARSSASDQKIIAEPLKHGPGQVYPSRPTNHMGTSLDCVRSRERPICNARSARLGDRLPPRHDRPAHRQEAEVGPVRTTGSTTPRPTRC